MTMTEDERQLTDREKGLIDRLFDGITRFNCLTHEDIAQHGGFDTMPEVGEALALIRNPLVAEEYGWTVPHVPRGRPDPDQVYRYIVVGLNGEVLNADDIEIIRTGALSTVRLIAAQTRNEAHALRLSGPMVQDKKFRKWAKDTAVILDGISTQASLEAQRLETDIVLARAAAALAATNGNTP